MQRIFNCDKIQDNSLTPDKALNSLICLITFLHHYIHKLQTYQNGLFFLHGSPGWGVWRLDFQCGREVFFKTCVAVKLVADDDYDVLISVSVLDQQVLSWSWSCNRHFLVLINKSCHGLDLATITSWSWSTSPVMVLILQPSLLGLGSTSPVMVLILQPSLGLGLFLHPGLDRSQCNTICIVKVKKLISYKLNEKWNEAVFQQ